jgi:hypothetical protein
MDNTRRSILKMFGVTAAAGVTGTAVAAVPVERPNPLTFQFEPPEGMVYQWKRMFVFDEPNMMHIVEMIRGGWNPVPMSRYAKLFPDSRGHYWIEHGGLVLMEKPARDIPKPKAHPLPWEVEG